MSQSFTAGPGGPLRGTIRVPGDKSISHRSIMLGSIARGTTRVSGFLEGADAISTMNIFRTLGVDIEGPHEGKVTIRGVGRHGLKPPAIDLDCGNAGTTMRLLCGLLASQRFECRLVGDASLSRRPMRRVTEPLGRMGARIDATDGRPPLAIHPVARLRAIDHEMTVASAQVKSALILAGLNADGVTRVTEPAPTRDHTERMLAAFGVDIGRQGATVSIRGGQELTATDIEVPADISSAAFFLVAGAIATDAELLLRHVGMNPTRTGVVDILRLMGADLLVENPREVGGEPVADLRIRSSELRGIDVPPELVPLAIDEFPVLFVAAACATGRTVVTGAEELRVKESDRVAVMADGLARLGIQCRATPDGMVIEGKGGRGEGMHGTSRVAGNRDEPVFLGGDVDSHGDHRPAMAFAVASLRAAAPIRIRDTANVATSFPNFIQLARKVGMQIDIDPA